MKWTKEEETILVKLLGSGSILKEIRKVFPYRSKNSIKDKIYALGFYLNKDNFSNNINNGEIDYQLFNQLLNKEPEIIEI